MMAYGVADSSPAEGPDVDEGEWLSCKSPRALLAWLAEREEGIRGRPEGVPRDRKLRLFAAACVRLAWAHLPARSRQCVEFIEQYAEGAEEGPWGDYSQRAQRAWDRADHSVRPVAEALNLFWDGYNLPASIESVSKGTEDFGADADAQLRRVDCVFGNPFRPVAAHPSWLSPEVRSLAFAAYLERSLPQGTLDPVRLSVLADALEDAGADSALIDHLRTLIHVRGCFALDLLTGRG
jgi:hypothetical protein